MCVCQNQKIPTQNDTNPEVTDTAMSWPGEQCKVIVFQVVPDLMTYLHLTITCAQNSTYVAQNEHKYCREMFSSVQVNVDEL